MARNSSRRIIGVLLSLFAGVGVMNTVTEAAAQDRVACFGRFMIDLPPGADVAGQRSEFMFGTVHSEQVTYGARGFAEQMERRAQDLRSGKDREKYQLDNVREAGSSDRRVFDISRKLLMGPSKGFEAYKFDQGHLFSIRQTGFIPEKLDEVFSDLQTIFLPQVRARRPTEIPTGPGLCIEHGFIATDGSERARESVEISLDFKQWPDMELTVSSSTMHKAEPSLLERIKGAEVPAEYVPLMRHIKTVREGRRDVGDYPGEESLEMVPSDGGYMTHTFRWESHFALNDPFKPALVVELTTGHLSKWLDKRPTISEQDAVALFDAVVNSIRLRPTTPAKPAIAPKAALGTPLATGRACPQSGVWQAEEGERRFLREGDTMPAIQVAGKASLLDRLRGERALKRQATMWTLVAYEADAAPGSGPVSDDASPT